MRSRTGRGQWRIGVDLGGTWIRVIAVDGRGKRRRLRAPSPGLGGLAAFLRHLWRRWAIDGRNVYALVVASKGVWTSAERRHEERRLHAFARRVSVMSDAEAAYRGALGRGAGVLLLAGTGSMALGRNTNGRWSRAGGWGPLLGDEGSAFWIGREWLRATLRGTDVLRARSILRSPDPVARIAALAPGVLRRAREGSRECRRIVARAQDALADLLVRISRELRLGPPVTVSWAGGLLEDAGFRSRVWRASRRAGARVKPAAPCESPATAVGRLAENLGRADEMAINPRRRRPPLRQSGPQRTLARSRHAQ